MAVPDSLLNIYAEYKEEAKKARAACSPLADFLGGSGSFKNHWCHQKFFDEAAAWAEEFLASSPSPEEAAEAVAFILKAASENRGKDVYWYYFAAQKHVLGLLPLLSAEASRDMAVWFENTYSKRDRLPLQNDILKTLKKQGK